MELGLNICPLLPFKIKDKCYRYWPNLGTTQYGPLTVTLKQVEELAEFEIRTLSLQMVSLKPSKKLDVNFHGDWRFHL